MEIKMEGYSVEDFDFSQIQSLLDQIFGNNNISFSELVLYLIEGNFSDFFQKIGNLLENILFVDLQTYRDLLGQVLMIALAGMLLSYLTNIFNLEKTGETAFFITYLMMITLLLGSFALSRKIAMESVEQLVTFMKVLLPIFAVAAGLATTGASAAIYYETVFVIISLCSWILLSVVIPLIETGMILSLVNHISREAILSKLRDLIFMLADWVLRTMMTGILGFQVLQNLIVPVVVGSKTKLAQTIIYHLPGVGEGAEAVGNALVQAGVMIRNGIGTAALIVILCICLIPLIKLWVMMGLFYLSAAVLQPAADGRVTECVQSAAVGNRFLARSVFMTAVLFFLTIALLCGAGQGGT
ncbi:MAG: stage III sporulation protein AE [Lachnospiraceae bacterium]